MPTIRPKRLRYARRDSGWTSTSIISGPVSKGNFTLLFRWDDQGGGRSGGDRDAKQAVSGRSGAAAGWLGQCRWNWRSEGGRRSLSRVQWMDMARAAVSGRWGVFLGDGRDGGVYG